MTFSIFDWLVISIKPKIPQNREAFQGLTSEEIRELKRMREEVRLAREQVKLFVSHSRSGLF